MPETHPVAIEGVKTSSPSTQKMLAEVAETISPRSCSRTASLKLRERASSRAKRFSSIAVCLIPASNAVDNTLYGESVSDKSLRALETSAEVNIKKWLLPSDSDRQDPVSPFNKVILALPCSTEFETISFSNALLACLRSIATGRRTFSA